MLISFGWVIGLSVGHLVHHNILQFINIKWWKRKLLHVDQRIYIQENLNIVYQEIVSDDDDC
jgi:hypothetical protein